MIRKFTGVTTREALRKLREHLGEEAVVLSTKQTPTGTEVLAGLPDDHDFAQDERDNQLHAEPTHEPYLWTKPQRDIHPPSQSTTHTSSIAARRENDVNQYMTDSGKDRFDEIAKSAPAEVSQATILDELKQMRQLLKEQMSMLTWRDVNEKNPLRSQLWRELIEAGFSAVFARTVVEKLPDVITEVDARRWLNDVMVRNLPIAAQGGDIVETGGVYSLVGPTGIGKTTTAAKIAARCVVRHGAQSIGLITTDSYRIGAQDQLRIYGKILGAQVYTAQNDQDLQQVLSSMERKRLVLIDTVGMGQRDARVAEQMQMLSASHAKRILILNAASQSETLDDVARQYRGLGLDGAILTKLDEAVKLGGALDVAIRHKLNLFYIATGQRVPEDLFSVDANLLIHKALRQKAAQAFTMSEEELQWKMARMPASEPNSLV